jgi:xanthine dehydrogenase/oxidase
MALPFATRKPAGPAAFEKLQSLIESDFTESTLHFYMNGTKIELPNPNPDWTLLDFIRSQHGFKGTKLGNHPLSLFRIRLLSFPRFCSDALPDSCFIFPSLVLGTKCNTNLSGCGEGGCGACTVVLQAPHPRHKRRLNHMAVNACLFPLVGGMDSHGLGSLFRINSMSVVGKHLITIEGLGNVDSPHPLQERIAKLHGSQ